MGKEIAGHALRTVPGGSRRQKKDFPERIGKRIFRW